MEHRTVSIDRLVEIATDAYRRTAGWRAAEWLAFPRGHRVVEAKPFFFDGGIAAPPGGKGRYTVEVFRTAMDDGRLPAVCCMVRQHIAGCSNTYACRCPDRIGPCIPLTAPVESIKAPGPESDIKADPPGPSSHVAATTLYHRVLESPSCQSAGALVHEVEEYLEASIKDILSDEVALERWQQHSESPRLSPLTINGVSIGMWIDPARHYWTNIWCRGRGADRVFFAEFGDADGPLGKTRKFPIPTHIPPTEPCPEARLTDRASQDIPGTAQRFDVEHSAKFIVTAVKHAELPWKIVTLTPCPRQPTTGCDGQLIEDKDGNQHCPKCGYPELSLPTPPTPPPSDEGKLALDPYYQHALECYGNEMDRPESYSAGQDHYKTCCAIPGKSFDGLTIRQRKRAERWAPIKKKLSFCWRCGHDRGCMHNPKAESE